MEAHSGIHIIGTIPGNSRIRSLPSPALMPHAVPHANLRQEPRPSGPARLLREVLLDACEVSLEVPMGHNAGDLQQHRRLLKKGDPGLLREKRPLSPLDCRQVE